MTGHLATVRGITMVEIMKAVLQGCDLVLQVTDDPVRVTLEVVFGVARANDFVIRRAKTTACVIKILTSACEVRANGIEFAIQRRSGVL